MSERKEYKLSDIADIIAPYGQAIGLFEQSHTLESEIKKQLEGIGYKL